MLLTWNLTSTATKSTLNLDPPGKASGNYCLGFHSQCGCTLPLVWISRSHIAKIIVPIYWQVDQSQRTAQKRPLKLAGCKEEPLSRMIRSHKCGPRGSTVVPRALPWSSGLYHGSLFPLRTHWCCSHTCSKHFPRNNQGCARHPCVLFEACILTFHFSMSLSALKYFLTEANTPKVVFTVPESCYPASPHLSISRKPNTKN